MRFGEIASKHQAKLRSLSVKYFYKVVVFLFQFTKVS